MLFANMNYLLAERGAMPLSQEDFLGLSPDDVWDIVSQLGYSFEVLNQIDLKKRHDALRKRDIKLVVLDVDGVFTDGGLYFTSDGEDSKKFNVNEVMSTSKAIERGLVFGLISASSLSNVV
mgnify:CR=1 FL=1